ncbi:protein TANC1-like [Poecilia reticulata]|uniref:protein TANC1-like n=1 Tax=Poecilia reticulata TaxID=8081 RepID=UPI0007EBECB8|nr:PREDICTED: protein TANC1-like [Poecilia reticulata]
MFRAVFGNKKEGGGKKGDKKSQKNAGVEVHMPCIQQRGSGQRATHHHGHNGRHLNRKRLTKGVSISLPSSPLLPRQGDIVSSQSCVKFQGRARKPEYVDGSSSTREALIFASCHGKPDHRGENGSPWACF